MKKNKHTGSNFDDFLKEEKIFKECTAEAIKRVIAFQKKTGVLRGRVSFAGSKGRSPFEAYAIDS